MATDSSSSCRVETHPTRTNQRPMAEHHETVDRMMRIITNSKVRRVFAIMSVLWHSRKGVGMGTMARRSGVMLIATFLISAVFSTFSGASFAVPAELKGKYEILKDEPSTHQRGKVKLIEFADFYCPH